MASKSYKGIRPADLAVKKGILRSLERIGADLTGKAQRLAPRDEGTLRASGHWEIKERAGFLTDRPGSMAAEIAVQVIFDVPYAAKQHEELSYSHTDGQAKYLEQPMKTEALKYQKEIERAIRDELKGGS